MADLGQIAEEVMKEVNERLDALTQQESIEVLDDVAGQCNALASAIQSDIDRALADGDDLEEDNDMDALLGEEGL